MIAKILATDPLSFADIEKIQYRTDTQRFVIAECHELLVSAITNITTINLTSIKVLSKLAFLVAESAKSETCRNMFSDSEIFLPVANLVALASRHLDLEIDIPNMPPLVDPEGEEIILELLNELKIQCLRAFANLCYEHDANRDHVFDTDVAVPFIVACLKSESQVVVNSCLMSMLNISMDNEPIEIDIIASGGLELILKIVDSGARGYFSDKPHESYDYDMAYLAAQLLSNIVECERAPSALATSTEALGNVKPLCCIFQLISFIHKTVLTTEYASEKFKKGVSFLDSLVTTIETISEVASIQRAIVTEELFSILLDFVDHSPDLPSGKSCESLESSSERVDDVGYKQVRKLVSKISTQVTMNDDNMKDVPNDKTVIDRLKHWMTLGHGTDGVREEDEIRMAGALSIGNLARSDQTCETLVKTHNVISSLSKLLKLEMQRLDSSGEHEGSEQKWSKNDMKSIVQVLHAVVGALKNLSLAVNVRPIMGESGVIELVSDLLELDNIKVSQFGAVGILKNVCFNNEANTYKILTGKEFPQGKRLADVSVSESAGDSTPLSKMVAFVCKATEDNDNGIRSEGGRCIANLVRCCHYSNGQKLIKYIVDEKGVLFLLQIVTGALLTKRTQASSPGSSSEESHVAFDAVPVETNVFPMVQNEGIVSLILLCSAQPDIAKMLVKYQASLRPTLVKIIKSDLNPKDDDQSLSSSEDIESKNSVNYPNEMKVNACLLLETLCRANAEFKSQTFKEFGADLLEVSKLDINDKNDGDISSEKSLDSATRAPVVSSKVAAIGTQDSSRGLSFDAAIARLVALIDK